MSFKKLLWISIFVFMLAHAHGGLAAEIKPYRPDAEKQEKTPFFEEVGVKDLSAGMPGPRVKHVYPGMPASSPVGLQRGDTILAIEGKRVYGTRELRYLRFAFRADSDTMRLLVARQGQVVAITMGGLRPLRQAGFEAVSAFDIPVWLESLGFRYGRRERAELVNFPERAALRARLWFAAHPEEKKNIGWLGELVLNYLHLIRGEWSKVKPVSATPPDPYLRELGEFYQSLARRHRVEEKNPDPSAHGVDPEFYLFNYPLPDPRYLRAPSHFYIWIAARSGAFNYNPRRGRNAEIAETVRRQPFALMDALGRKRPLWEERLDLDDAIDNKAFAERREALMTRVVALARIGFGEGDSKRLCNLVRDGKGMGLYLDTMLDLVRWDFRDRPSLQEYPGWLMPFLEETTPATESKRYAAAQRLIEKTDWSKPGAADVIEAFRLEHGGIATTLLLADALAEHGLEKPAQRYRKKIMTLYRLCRQRMAPWESRGEGNVHFLLWHGLANLSSSPATAGSAIYFGEGYAAAERRGRHVDSAHLYMVQAYLDSNQLTRAAEHLVASIAAHRDPVVAYFYKRNIDTHTDEYRLWLLKQLVDHPGFTPKLRRWLLDRQRVFNDERMQIILKDEPETPAVKKTPTKQETKEEASDTPLPEIDLNKGLKAIQDPPAGLRRTPEPEKAVEPAEVLKDRAADKALPAKAADSEPAPVVPRVEESTPAVVEPAIPANNPEAETAAPTTDPEPVSETKTTLPDNADPEIKILDLPESDASETQPKTKEPDVDDLPLPPPPGEAEAKKSGEVEKAPVAPLAAEKSQAKPAPASRNASLLIAADESMRWNGKPVSWEELPTRIKETLGGKSPLVIQAAKEVKFQVVLRAMEIAKTAGQKNILFESLKEK